MAKRTYQTEFHPEAIREIRKAIQWYRDRNEQAADQLRSLVQSAESLIERSPESCASYLHDTRGYRFQKFPLCSCLHFARRSNLHRSSRPHAPKTRILARALRGVAKAQGSSNESKSNRRFSNLSRTGAVAIRSKSPDCRRCQQLIPVISDPQ